MFEIFHPPLLKSRHFLPDLFTDGFKILLPLLDFPFTLKIYENTMQSSTTQSTVVMVQNEHTLLCCCKSSLATNGFPNEHNSTLIIQYIYILVEASKYPQLNCKPGGTPTPN